ncbi:NACHT domain-containing NTPase [Rhodoferax sp. U11-2br]|uniref:NACHT domain-containing protein n=1 Tax=Rhodoferax sp. U11-2br TaxID=2838878 RepID=UPI001BECE811|nr:hypothetical protein [Rhodoferax sp. U11-2br]MBT3066735.1 hypothetical protein [Rhodoferax sp. U11-2br]
MAEAGGATTQAGIFYQNSVAALYLADLLELGAEPPRERVIEVRVEAPTDVDDIVVRYADGHCQYLNVKIDITPGGDPWKALWKSLRTQFNRMDFGAFDQLTVVLEGLTPQAKSLRELCQRAGSSLDEAAFRASLAEAHSKLLSGIESIVGSPAEVLEILRRTMVQILSEDQISSEFSRRRLGDRFVLPATLLTTLRDIAGGGARVRAMFHAAPLRRRLVLEHDIKILEPAEWGVPAYRATVAATSRIQIPGTSISGSTEDLFVWPRAHFYERAQISDFEDEDLLDRPTEISVGVDMQAFPSEHLNRCVVVAGPGHGKSALLIAMAGRLAKGPYVPVLIPLASLAVAAIGVIEFLMTEVNRDFEIKADWQRLAEQGLVVMLFDGLDEIPLSSRPALLKRIETFSARYSTVPWMLTVRDPSVLSEPSDSRLIELLPLNDEDMVRFVEVMKRRLSTIDVYAFIRRLDIHPDIKRLARIPLFLSILLATVNDVNINLPATRSDLIEGYLKTLFNPHIHKAIVGRSDHGGLLREVAETLAFERLERQEIGASEREVREIISRTAQSTAEAEMIFERLRANGILRQQSSIRLQFPFPIVQEYLASCYLIRRSPESLANRIDDAIQRPWAQVIQFSLEQHPDPVPVIRAMLDRADDAFFTGLRLVGRCIANGTRVNASIRDEVADRLVQFWVGASLAARSRVGGLIAESFSNPMRPALRKAVHHVWLMSDGGGQIVSSENDQELTMSVLSGIMDRPLDRFVHYHSFKPAVSAAGDVAFRAILDRLLKSDAGPHREGLGSLFEHFLPGSVSRDLVLATASDDRLPRKTRLRILNIAGSPLNEESIELIRNAFLQEDEGELWSAIRLLHVHPLREDEFKRILRNEQVPLERRKRISGYLNQLFATADERNTFIATCITESELHPDILDIMRLFSARFGDRLAFTQVLEKISDGRIDLAAQAISLLGHHPDRILAERAADLAEKHVVDVQHAVQLGRSATTGMLYVFEMDSFLSGTLRHAAPHAGIGRWMQVVEQWSCRDDLGGVQKLELLTCASQLGAVRARARLFAEVLSLDPDAAVFDLEDDYGHIMSSAIREVQRQNTRLPLSVGEKFVRAKRPNLPQVGTSVIAAHGNHDALQLLLKLHREITEWFVRSTLEDAIESLSAKLCVAVRRDGDTLS